MSGLQHTAKHLFKPTILMAREAPRLCPIVHGANSFELGCAIVLEAVPANNVDGRELKRSCHELIVIHPLSGNYNPGIRRQIVSVPLTAIQFLQVLIPRKKFASEREILPKLNREIV